MTGEEITYLCTQLGKGYITEDKLESHLKMVHEVCNIKCEYCELIFKTLISHKNHVYSKG